LPNINTNVISPQFLSNPLNIESFEEVESVPRIGDLWLPVAAISPSHQVRFFFLGVDALFVVGDKMVRIEHSKVESKV
jgi:hypothetical protein